MVIDQNGVIRYSSSGVNVSNINSKISELSATDIDDNNDLNLKFELVNNYPNPFNPSTAINFTVDTPQTIKLQIVDLRGRLVRTIVNKSYPAGRFSVLWNGLNDNGLRAASGMYVYRLAGEKQIQTRKMLLVR